MPELIFPPHLIGEAYFDDGSMTYQPPSTYNVRSFELEQEDILRSIEKSLDEFGDHTLSYYFSNY